MLSLQRYVERDIRSAHPPQKISKPSRFLNFFINQTFLVNIYAENTSNLKNRAGRDFFGGVQLSVNSVVGNYQRVTREFLPTINLMGNGLDTHW